MDANVSEIGGIAFTFQWQWGNNDFSLSAVFIHCIITLSEIRNPGGFQLRGSLLMTINDFNKDIHITSNPQLQLQLQLQGTELAFLGISPNDIFNSGDR